MSSDPPEIPTGAALPFAAASFVVSMLVLAIKVGAWWWTDSVVLLADAAESSLDVVTALLLVLAVRVSARPPDARHPWGHGKVEYFSSGFQGALVLAAGGAVAIESVRQAMTTPEPLDLGAGLGLSAAATLLNLGLALALIRAGGRLRSPALSADGRHNLADVVTTLGGWTGLGLAWLTGLWILDPLVGLLVAAQILWTGGSMIRTAVDGLMDATIPADEIRELEQAFAGVLQDAPGCATHQLRARRSSDTTFVDCVLHVPGDMSVHDAHTLCDRMEAAAATVLPGARVQIHVEPRHQGGDSPQETP